MNCPKTYIQKPDKYTCMECQNTPHHKKLTLPNGKKTCIHFFQERMWTYHQTKRFSNTKKLEKTHHYEVTLTTKPGTPDAAKVVVTKLQKFLTSKQFKPTVSWKACLEHASTNAHIHIYSNTKNYCPAKDVFKLNQARVSVSRLKTPLDILKWKNYINKGEDDKVIFNNLEEINKYLQN